MKLECFNMVMDTAISILEIENTYSCIAIGDGFKCATGTYEGSVGIGRHKIFDDYEGMFNISGTSEASWLGNDRGNNLQD